MPPNARNPGPADEELLDPGEFLAANQNANTRKNIDSAKRSYTRTMAALSARLGEEFEPLETASVDDLPYLLSRFFQAARKSETETYSSATLHTLHNSLRKYLKSRPNGAVDIVTDVRFNQVRDILRVKAAKAMAAGRGPGCDAKAPLLPEHLIQAAEAGVVGRENPDALNVAVYIALVVGFGLRSAAECYQILCGDLVYGEWDEGKGRYNSIGLTERITKTRRGGHGSARELKPKVFANDECPETCYVRTITQYQRMKRREQKTAESAFFLNPVHEANLNPAGRTSWYAGTGLPGSTRMGKNQVSRLLPSALEKIGIDVDTENLSAISLRKGQVQSAADAFVPALQIQRAVGHKNPSSQASYISSAGLHHEATQKAIHRKMFHNEVKGYGEELLDLQRGGSSGASGSLGGSSSHRTDSGSHTGRSASRSPPRRRGGSGKDDRSQRVTYSCTERSESPARRNEEESTNEMRSHRSRSPPPQRHNSVGGHESNSRRQGIFMAENSFSYRCVPQFF